MILFPYYVSNTKITNLIKIFQYKIGIFFKFDQTKVKINDFQNLVNLIRYV